MSTTIQRGSFVDINGWQFGTVKVMGFAGRTPSPRWFVECTVCRSKWKELHKTLVDAGSGYRCKNSACTKGLIQERSTPQRVDRVSEPLPTPAPARVSVPRDYELYARFMREQGFSNADIATIAEWQRLGPNHQARLLKPALIAEEAVLKRRELEALGLALENQERERFRRTYGV